MGKAKRMTFLAFDPPRHVVALSGGKDSTALALALHEKEPRDYDYVITPKFERGRIPQIRKKGQGSICRVCSL